MSAHLQKTIRALEQELEVKQSECADIERALVPLRRMAGVVIDRPARARVARPTKPQRAHKRTDGRTDGRTEQTSRHRAQRSLPDDAKLQAILRALERAPGHSMRPGELADALGLDIHALRYRMRPLLESGRLTVTGATTTRMIHLGKPAAAVKSNGSTKATPASTMDRSDARDRAVLERVSAAGPGGRSVRELMISLPDETEATIVNSITHLKTRKQIQDAGGGKWVSL